MPKIEVIEKILESYIGEKLPVEDLETVFPSAKAELDGYDFKEGVLKVELNDTNRPDLWSTAGLGRQLKTYRGGEKPEYDFFSTQEVTRDAGHRRVVVDENLQGIRPYITAFAVKGKPIDDATLKDLIQTQEKLCWNYGQKRKAVAMGVYRSDLIKYPVRYTAVNPEATRFVPLGMEETLSLREICRKHPKGVEFGGIVSQFERFPFITDAEGEVLSFPPVINSDRIGAVEEGDAELFIEMTGTDIKVLTLAASIVACDLADAGYDILPVQVEFPYESELGSTVVFPYYFQESVRLEAAFANKMLGTDLSVREIAEAVRRVGSTVEESGDGIIASPPPYRNDFLHPVDVLEDVMIGRGMDSFEPVLPEEFTVGRLSPQEEFAREVKDIMVGLGFQEMVYNYLGSGRDYITRMNRTGENIIRIANPMTENYEYVRDSILPCLLNSEAVSGNAVYPHHIFEVGKIAYLDSRENYGTRTKNYLGFMSASKDTGFNEISSQVSAIFFYLNRDYALRELEDPRFIPGRCAEIVVDGDPAGCFGEIHPSVLENWGIGMPITAGEVDLDLL
jgi:phenylalanyl-tRNA synthetase beta chain